MPSLSLLIFFFHLFTLSTLSAVAAHTTTLSLTPAAAVSPPPQNPWQRLNHLSAASSARAHHLKHPNASATQLPLFPRGYGGYSVSLRIGTPPQTLSFVMDTGSSLVWFPCTRRYACSSCDFPESNSANITTFIPKSSSSSRILGCRNPKCRWLFPDVQCQSCQNNPTGCNQLCPPYIIQYGSGSTSGLLLSETLNFPGKSVPNFVFGCSVFSSRQPAGIAGFGRGPESLPSQMRLKSFSYCLVSHRFDDKPVSSNLVLTAADGGAAKTGSIKYTPFRKNPSSSNSVFQDYYYVTLRKITVGGVKIRAPYRYLQVPDSAGNGGTIVDSGTTFTFMESHVFELVAQQFEKQMGRNYSRSIEVEKQSGLRPCFNVLSDAETINLPQLIFHFKGGAKMILPLADYFSFLDDSVICLTIISSRVSGNAGAGGPGPGPSIILGNYQQQDFYVEYDLENQRLGFQKQICKRN